VRGTEPSVAAAEARLAERLLPEIPDAPTWVEVRELLRSGECRIFPGPSGAVVAGVGRPHLAVVGRPGVEAIRAAASAAPSGAELLVQVDAEDEVSRALPDWLREGAVIHAMSLEEAQAVPLGSPKVALLSRNRPPSFAHLPGVLRRELADALEARSHVAAAFVDELPVTFCYTASETETLWDASIDTLEPFRRRGLARDCARFLIQHMAVHGKAPVWGSFDSNAASLRLAEDLGFRPAGRLIVFFRPGEHPRS
jgi:RimJ/RimL family protein N-acetyltransferase